MSKRFLSLLFLALTAPGAAAWGKTPDRQPPSVETVCDGETGAAFGLCNAYCEAMDCDSPDHRASDNACEQVRRNFERKTGRPLPCDVRCPCPELIPLFGDLVSGAAQVEMCIVDPEIISVHTPAGDFVAVINTEPPPFCSANLEPPFVELTSAEVAACRDVLRRASESQGVPCVPPE